MRVARLCHLALACIFFITPSLAQENDAETAPTPVNAGTIYEKSRLDVTIPLARDDWNEPNGDGSVSVPVENLATPMRCMAAWSHLAERTVRSPEETLEQHPDFTEAMASAHWQHWLKQDLDAHRGSFSPDFHQRRLAAERDFATALAEDGEIHTYRSLGACYVAPSERQIADPTLLLRNFMVEYQGLADSYAVPILQRQLRSFPITETIEMGENENCDLDATVFAEHARVMAVNRCFDRGGILASLPKMQVANLDGVCRVSSSIQCENIP